MNIETSSGKPPLVIIAGPTASGKSALALALSRLVPATIINADASQVYADLRILSARPLPDEEAQAPHRLFGHIDGAESCSAAHWAKDAKTAITEAYKDGRLPVLVGGTGLYLRTLLDGIASTVVFGYPGGAVLPIYDALFKQKRIRHILVRHEQARPMQQKAMPAPPASPAWCSSHPAPARPTPSPASPMR
jgi:energy-coupling factor transporter ATP-binding protein EcfA2